MPNKKYMDEHLLLHTLRIELMNGKVLLYNIDAIPERRTRNLAAGKNG